ncbi:DUF2807 domain-containing protein [Aquimarina sp. ERC-38]|uniref:GIN domain-containing protein n=1 Tax=Aquimarina sp. ERC-38 TaxID=2949996 RepID=UPI00224721B4|nr:DUF2807 domain-containing protein [Aquimarina sp. ERC-38]UZO80355.1 DUF2807 domain-containing protein [Aquimarina sp. ERC-38]
MKTFTYLYISLCLCGQLFAQQSKIKGNKIVETKQHVLDAFHSLKLSNEFNVILDEGSEYIATIEADSNLHKHIETTVTNGVLSISSGKKFSKYRKLEVRIYYPNTITNISLYDEVKLKAVTAITSVNFKLDAHDASETYLTVKADTLKTFLNHKANVELHAMATTIYYQLQDDTTLKGIVMSDDLAVDMYQKTTAKLEGESKHIRVRANQEANFLGNKLISEKAVLMIKDKADMYLQATSEVKLDARGTSKVYLIGNAPVVTINVFEDTPTLFKKEIDYTPGLFSF